jgi:hypothetical protein
MTPSQVRQEIGRLITYLLRTGLAISANMPVTRRFGALVVVEPATNVRQSLDARRFSEFGALDDYLTALRRGDFACVLLDGSLLQIAFAFRGDELVTHRLCFHPCPIDLSPQEIEGMPLDEMIELYLENDWRSRLRLRTPLRFDFDVSAAKIMHSASHLHLSGSHCRIPVFGPLSLGHFVRFVFRHFYPDLLPYHLDLKDWNLSASSRSIDPTEEEDLFIECRVRVPA